MTFKPQPDRGLAHARAATQELLTEMAAEAEVLHQEGNPAAAAAVKAFANATRTAADQRLKG